MLLLFSSQRLEAIFSITEWKNGILIISKDGVGFFPDQASFAYFFFGASAIVIRAFCIARPAGIGSGTGILGDVGSVGDDTSRAEVIVKRGL